MTERVKGKTPRGGRRALRAVPRPGHGQARRPAAAAELGKLAVFSGVREFPVRVKCATLAWHTLKAALDGAGAPVSTESEGPAAESGGA